MKKLDWYILRTFLGTFFFSIALIIIIVIVFDISEKIEDFVTNKPSFEQIVKFYLNFIPYFVNMFSPLFTFIAVIFFTSRLATRTEVIAILSSGVSFYRFLYPYFLGALVLAILSVYLNNSVIPHANKKRLDFENKYIFSPYRNKEINIHRQILPGTFIYMERYNNQDNIGYKFSLEKLDKGKLYYKLLSEQIKWDSSINKWSILDYHERYLTSKGEIIKRGARIDTTYNFTPADFSRRVTNVETMNFTELNTFIEEEKIKGASKIEFYEVEKYKRFANPFSTFILTLIGVSLASRKVRGGTGLHLGLGLLIAFSYILFMQVSHVFAQNGVLPAYIAVWIPNILYSFLAAFFVTRAQK
ncbi:MAG: LptF/LptG family permease [Bacteroidetes bacterium]|nr:LptF/LptG family permease [Bacteroidota bacterium]